MSGVGCVCPFCTAAPADWPKLYQRRTRPNGLPSPRFGTLVAVTCLACGARWTRETGRWVKGSPPAASPTTV